jgi:hypothetical protein
VTYQEQLERWVAGESVHRENCCCPDFSCCRPELAAPAEVRQAFIAAGSSERTQFLSDFLSAVIQADAKLPKTEMAVTGKPILNPRTEADAQICRALQVVVDADETTPEPGETARLRRDYTLEELETLFFSLGMATVQLAKLPGGKEARDNFYRRAETVLLQRGRRDITDTLLNKEAVAIVKQAFGDDVDLRTETIGRQLTKLVEMELGDLASLREKLFALSSIL